MMTRLFLLARAGGVALLAALALGGCERALTSFDLVGNVAATAPDLIGPERLDVVIPATGAQARLGPVARNGDVTVWQTLDGITLSLRQGVLVGTRGLGDDLMSADAEGILRLLRGTAGDGPLPHIRSRLDGEDRTVFRSYQCRRSAVSTDAGLRRVDILCISPSDRHTNIYWLDSRGVIVRSRQWIGPTLGHMDAVRTP